MPPATPGKASAFLPPAPDLDERARRVLSEVVRGTIRDGNPVGSQLIARSIDCSSATVRAVMADLEALGLLEKPHTSAGRVPTALGYRYYVDALLHLEEPRPEERALIEQHAGARAGVSGLLAETSRLLHSLTRHAGVVLSPRPSGDRIARLELVPLREGRLLAVLVAKSGAVQNRLIAPTPGQPELSPSELAQAQGYLNSLLGDLTLAEARLRLQGELERDRALLEETRSRALALGALAVQLSPDGPELRIEGQSSFLEEPAYAQDVAKVRALFRVLDEKERVLGVLDRTLASDELSIFIGAESGFVEPEIAIVAAPYRWAGEVVGAVGVIGPTRMDYARVIPLVELTARTVGLALGE